MKSDGLVHSDGPAILAGNDAPSLQVPDGFDIFSAQFSRDGDDLVVAANGSPPLTVIDYFTLDSPPGLAMPNGAMLRGDVVELLAGPRAPGQYAQADAPEGDVGGAEAIGRVETLSGSSTAARVSGETVDLAQGDPVFQGDVIQTADDSTLGIRLEDGTLASMSSQSRLVLNEFVYETGGSDNWMVVDLVEGAFAFLTGAIAPSGGMEITTPVAVMAIRGTMPVAFVSGEQGATQFFAASDKDYELLHVTTRELLGIVSSESGISLSSPDASLEAIQLDPETLDEIDGLLDVLNDAAAELGLLGIEDGSGFHTYTGFGNIDGNLASLIEFLLLLNNALAEEAVLEVEDPDQFLMADAELVASPDQAATDEMSPVVIPVLDNDSNPDGGDLTVVFADVPNGQGSVTVVDGQSLNFDPGTDFDHLALGETTDVVITYVVADATGAVASSTATVTLTGINQAPAVAEVGQTSLDEQTDTQPLNTTIAVAFTDVDLNNVGHAASVVGVAVNGEDGGLTLDDAALMALVSPGTVTKNAGDGNGSADFHFMAASSVFDYLADGEVVTLTYTIEIDDGDGGTTPQTFDIVVTGTNDAPVIDETLSDVAETVVEDGLNAGGNPVGSPNAAGQIAASDVDNGGKNYSFSPQVGTYGTFEIDATGAWTYMLNDGAADHLALGEEATDAFIVTVTDGFGATDQVEVTLTVVGSNDAPVVTDVAAAAVEDGLAITAGFAGGDVDSDDDAGSLVYTVATQPSEGTVTNNGDGTYNFNPGNAFQDLAAGETRQVTFTYTATDAHGAVSEPATATVTVTGTNDDPVIVAGSTDDSGAVTELADGHQDETSLDHVAQGTIAFGDADLSDTHGAGVVAGGPGYLGTFALGAIDQTGKTIGWTFTLADAAIDYLAKDETLVQTYTVTIDDGNGGTVAQVVSVTVTGTNDAPTIVAETTEASGSVTELADTTGSSHEHLATGTVAFADVDVSDAHSASFAPGDTGYVGSFVLGGVDAAGNTVGWTFTVTDSDIDNLPKNTTLTQTYTVTIDDGYGGSVQQVVTISVNGSNDAPVIVVDGDDVDSAVVEEADGSLTADGELSVNDVSVLDVITAEVTAVSADGDHDTVVEEAVLLDFMQVTSPVIGSTQAMGTLEWNFNSNGEFFDFLADGETLVLTYSITVSDGTATDTHPVTITIQGTNDQPVITAETLAGSVTETLGTPGADATLGDSGLITFSDLDLSDGHSVTVSSQATPLGTLAAQLTGTATGGATGEITWTYTVDADQVEYLADGEFRTESFEITLSDGNGGSFTRTVVVTIDGSNDAPVVTSQTLTGSVAETPGTPAADATVGDSGAIGFTDVDLTDVHSVTPTGTFNAAASTQGAPLGTLAAQLSEPATDGGIGEVTWTYSVDAALVEHLAQGQTLTEAFDITVSDGEGGLITRTIVVTVTGTNDAPVVAGTSDVTGAVTENVAGDATPSQNTPATGQIDFSDVDTGDAPEATVSTGAGDVALVYTPDGGSPGALPAGLDGAAIRGAFSIGTDGAWSYDASALDLEALGAGDTIELTYTVVVTDDLGATDTVPVAITITGTNDAPVVDLNGAGADGIDNAVTFDRDGPVEIAADGTLSDVDSDTLQSMSVKLTNRPDGGNESLSLNTTALALALSAGLAHAYDPGTGILTITGNATLADYETILQGVVYNNTSERPNADPREIEVVVNDGDLSSTVATTTVDVIPAPDVISFAILDIGAGEEFYAIAGDGDQSLESGETAHRLSKNLNSQGGILNDNGPDDPVLISANDTGTGESETVTFANATGFGADRSEYLNNGQSVTFQMTAAALGIVAFTVNAIGGEGASANVTIDVDGVVGNGGYSLGDLDHNDRVVIDFSKKTITVNGELHDDGGFFDDVSGSDQITIGSISSIGNEDEGFSVKDLEITPKEASGTDPIVLDLGAPGFDLSGTAAFDLDNDGEQQSLGWTAGEDGIVVMDVDGSGAIESGNEVFSPYFDGGGFADALEALASLDLNGDGVIDAQDAAFADVLVWVDANSDGQSQSGELIGFAELGITSLDLDAEDVAYTIDGQTIVAEGLFTRADGSTADFVAVELVESAEPQGEVFALTDLSIDEVVIDYQEGDVIDLTRLGFELATGQLNAEAAAQYVDYDQANGVLSVDSDGAGGEAQFEVAADFVMPPPSVLIRLSDGDTTGDIEIA